MLAAVTYFLKVLSKMFDMVLNTSVEIFESALTKIFHGTDNNNNNNNKNSEILTYNKLTHLRVPFSQ